MTVTTTANSITYAGNGTTTAFAFPYVFFAPSDLVVTLIITATGVAVVPPPVLNGAATYDFTVTGVVSSGEYASGGTVTFNTAPLATHTVSIVRAVPATQLVTLIDNTKFPAETVNVEFDKLTVLAQQALTVTSNVDNTALQIPANEVGLVVTAAPAASRAGLLLLWDGVGNLSTLDPASIIGGSVPVGPAGGALAGTYPNPTINPTAFPTPIVTPFTASATWIPNPKMVYALLFTLGAGAAGGSTASAASGFSTGGGGGGAGGWSVKFVLRAAVTPSQAVTIGAAGAPAAAGNNAGGAGGATSIGALCIANGGSGGAGSPAGGTATGQIGGLGGTAGTGDIKAVGAPGGTIGQTVSSVGTVISGAGGSSALGGGGRGKGTAATAAGEAGTGFGSGGSGGVSIQAGAPAAGGAGTIGFAFIVEYCTP